MADTASTIDTMVDTASTINLEPLMLDVPGYGYVLLILVLTWFLLFWQGNMVGRARTKYKVELPTMYSDTETTFNCYQVITEFLIQNERRETMKLNFRNLEGSPEHIGACNCLPDSTAGRWSV